MAIFKFPRGNSWNTTLGHEPKTVGVRLEEINENLITFSVESTKSK
jgi:hypothetical protein